MPSWRVNESKIRNLNLIRVHDLYQVRSGVFHFFGSELVPPVFTLTIEGAIMPLPPDDGPRKSLEVLGYFYFYFLFFNLFITTGVRVSSLNWINS